MHSWSPGRQTAHDKPYGPPKLIGVIYLQFPMVPRETRARLLVNLEKGRSMRSSLRFVCWSVVSVSLLGTGLIAAEKTTGSAERGRDIMFHRSLNPRVWSFGAYDTAWKQWGLKEKPANYEQAFRDRYGLHAAPFDNHGRPMGLMEASALLTKGLVNNCLLCHAGSVAGETIIGLGNASMDIETLFQELTAADGFTLNVPTPFSYVRGTIDPISPTVFLMEMRDSELNLQKPLSFGYTKDVCSRPPAWWQIKRKQTRDWTGPIDARSTRVDMVNLLSPLNSGVYIKKQESSFADIAAYLLTIESPKYPFSIDTSVAARGEAVFATHCAKCHGSYGPNGTYPNKIVPLEKIGTDPTLAAASNGRFVEHFNRSWLAREISPDGEPIQLVQNNGYQAPPLDGVWATAPYFHNASAPTVYHVLNSKARPKIFTRSYRTDREAYDTAKLGLKIEVVEKPLPPDAPAHEQHKVYDTTLPGRHNTGHTYGDKLSDDERMAVIEYLKTL
jgi:mono/diheme cytochrome c family protein